MNVLRSDFVNIIMIVDSSFIDDTAGIRRISLIRVRKWINTPVIRVVSHAYLLDSY